MSFIYVVHNSNSPSAATCQNHLRKYQQILCVVRLQRLGAVWQYHTIDGKMNRAGFPYILPRYFDPSGVVNQKKANHSYHIKVNRAWPGI